MVVWGQYIDHDMSFTPQSLSTSTFQGLTNCRETCENEPPCFPMVVCCFKFMLFYNHNLYKQSYNFKILTGFDLCFLHLCIYKATLIATCKNLKINYQKSQKILGVENNVAYLFFTSTNLLIFSKLLHCYCQFKN